MKPFDEKQALQLYNEGFNDIKIAAKLKTTKGKVTYWRLTHDLPTTHPMKGGIRFPFRMKNN